jgi:RHS repeat-associated protein
MAKTEQTSPPAGTGYAPGIGEAFSINLGTGQGTYSYKMPLPQGVAGHTPNLVLEYVHAAGHGPFGLGFRLPLRSISRRLDFGAPSEDVAERILDAGTDIAQTADGTFRALRETTYSRYSREGSGWRINERNGLVHELGLSAAARVAPPDHPDRPVEWLVERTIDTSGNEISYAYRLDQGMAYPASIRYAAYELRFDYEERPDARLDGRAGFLRRRALRCTRIRLILDPGAAERAIRSYEFAYLLAPGGEVSLLAEIRLVAHGAAADGSQDVRRPPVRFSYSEFDPGQRRVRLMTGDAGLPPPLQDEDVALVTLDDGPLPGVLMHRGGREYYWANRGDGRFAPPRPLGVAPLAQSLSRDGLAFVDMDGSGTADLMVANPDSLQGYYENGGSAGWRDFVAFPRGRRATPPWSGGSVRLADVDGDGVIDALASQRRGIVWWRNQGRLGWSAARMAGVQAAGVAGVDLSDPDVHLADMTGDGGLDLVRVRSGLVEYWPGLGGGRFGDRVAMRGSPRLRRDETVDTLLLADLDGDGCADLVLATPGGIAVFQNRNGQEFADPVAVADIPPPIPGTARAINMNGSAAAGLVWNSPGRTTPSYVQLEFSGRQPPYLLTGMENGAGLVSEISYRSAVADFVRDRDRGFRWATNFPFPYLVVGQTRERDIVSGRETVVDLIYHEAHFERGTRQFQGFRRAERTERGDASRPDTRQVHHFLMAQERLPGAGPERSALNGMLERVETYLMDGSPAQDLPSRVETSEHGLRVLETAADGRSRVFVWVALHTQVDSERSADARIEEKTYEYDDVGNVVRETHRGSGTLNGAPQPARERRTEVTYAVSPTGRILDRPARAVVRDAAGALLSEKRWYYDGPDFVGLPLGQIDRGLVSREEEWVLAQAEFDAHYAGMDQAALGFVSDTDVDGVAAVFSLSRRCRHDARGLRLAMRDPLGNESSVSYDASGLLRTQLTDTLGTTVFDHDRATGQITAVTYANGAVTRFAHDAQGRVLRSALPGEDIDDAGTVYAYDETVVPNRRIARFRQPGGASSVGITYFDGTGKEFQQRVEVEPGRFLVSGLKLPNPWGDLREEFEPTFAPGGDFALPETAGRPSRQVHYDGHGRVVGTVNFNGGVSSAEYRPFAVVLRDANDNDGSAANVARGQFDTPREERFDVFRHLVSVTERAGPGREVTTSYEVGTRGELLAISDARGEKARYSYDGRGNRLTIALREAGGRRMWYDARRGAVRSLDAAGNEIRAEWDALGRQTRLSGAGGLLEEYVYDDPARNALGRLAEVRYPGGRQEFTYGPSGRLLRRDYFFDGEADPQSLAYEYDPLGRETAIVHGDGTRIERQLTLNGWLSRIPGVIDGLDLDPRGLPTEIRYANGVRTSLAYTPGPGRISSVSTVGPQGALQQIEFGFDQMDVLIRSDDASPGGAGTRTFDYDPLYQLSTMHGTENGAPVLHRYDYAADYNLRRNDEAGVTIHYDDAARPDRLSGLTPNGGVRFATGHDANGNLLGLPGQAYGYNPKGELTRVTRSDGLVAEYAYDHLGMRVGKTVTDAAGQVTRTLFLGTQAEVRNGVTTCFAFVGPYRVAALTMGTVRFLHDDGLGGTALVTDAAGQVIGSVVARPFGNTASSSGDLDVRSYSLHPVDAETGLVYMRRRYYSPLIGRFLTPDILAIHRPESFLHAPQGLHLYAFVANDPLNKTDPTGESFWSVLGAVVGAVVGVVVAVAIIAAVVMTGGIAGVLLGIALALGASLVVTGVSYVIASNVDPNSAFGSFMRGFMIGFNAGMNGVLAGAIFGPVVGVAVGVLNFLAAFDTIAQSPVYQGILGWSSWIMPMSWGATALGLVFFVVNVVMAGVTFQQWDAVKIDKLTIDWKTGSIVMSGGLITGPTAFAMGNFVFMNPSYVDGSSPDRTYDAVLGHETGHTLSNAAFGTAFGIFDIINENVLGAGMNDYGEKIAEGHAPPGSHNGRPSLPMWS